MYVLKSLFLTQHNSLQMDPSLCLYHSFLLLHNIPGVDCHSLFNHPPVEGHLGFLQFWAIVTKASMNVHTRALCEHKFSLLWDKCPRLQ